MLEGIDLSHHQSYSTGLNHIIKKDTSFVFIKLTEGRSYVDKMAETHFNTAREHEKVVGFYHYARPDLNADAELEAINLLYNASKLAEKYNYSEPIILIIDWEGKALSYPISWAETFCKHILHETGKPPVFYVQASQLTGSKYTNIVKLDCGLWVAKYGTEPKNVKPWTFKAFWQYTNTPIDKSKFYGNRENLLKYGTQLYDSIVVNECHCKCGCDCEGCKCHLVVK